MNELIKQQEIKQDINFLEYPLWAVDTRSGDKEFQDIEGYKYRAGFKVPTYLDVIFLYYLLFITQQKCWKREITVSKYNVLRNCGLSKTPYYAARFIDSLKRWINITVEYEGTFYDNHEYNSIVFNIIDTYKIDKKSKKVTIKFNEEWLIKIKESTYFKIIKFENLLKLKSPIAARLYEILVKTFQNRDTWEIDAHKLAVKMTMKEKYLTHILQKIKPAINKINKRTDLKIDLKIRKRERGKATLIFIKKGENKNKEKEKQQNIEQKTKKQKISKEEIQQLLFFVREGQKNDDIVKDIIKKYAKKKGYEYCLKNIIYTNKNSNENYKVYLLQALENNWGEFEDITNIKEKEEDKKECIKENKNKKEDTERKKINVKYTINNIRNKKVEIEGKVYKINRDGSVTTEKGIISPGMVFAMLCAGKAKLIEEEK